MDHLKLICVGFALTASIIQTTPQKIERITEYTGCSIPGQMWIQANSYTKIEGFDAHFDVKEEIIWTRGLPVPPNELPKKD